MLLTIHDFAHGTIRADDHSLSAEQELLRESYARLCAAHTSTERVREVEGRADRFDHDLWRRLVGAGATRLAVDEALGGDDGTMIELVVVAEEIGRRAVSTAFCESAVIGRLAARLDAGAQAELADRVLAGTPVVTAMPHPATPGVAQLVPCGSVADSVVALVGGELVIASGGCDAAPPNLAGAPLGRWTLVEGKYDVLPAGAAGAAFTQLVDEWRLLLAATLMGLVRTVLDDAVDYARERIAFDVPIGSFQAIAHPLADVWASLAAGRRLVHKAAWFADHEPGATRYLSEMAFVHATRLAARAVQVGVHVQGGFGVTDDSDMQLYYRRATGWPALLTRPGPALTDTIAAMREPTATFAANRPLEVSA